MSIACIIEARMHSSRLPGKVLKPVLGIPLLELMIERLKLARTLDQIIIATTDNPSDDAIEQLGQRLHVGVFRGSEEDVLDRVLKTAQVFNADIVVETTGDCPLIDPAIIDKVVADFRIGGADFVSNTLEYTTPRGTDVRVFQTESLALIAAITDDPVDREHVSLYFWEHPQEFILRNVPTNLAIDTDQLRLTVDTPEDFQLIKEVFEELYPENPHFSLADILDLFQRRPDLPVLNQHINQKPVRMQKNE